MKIWIELSYNFFYIAVNSMKEKIYWLQLFSFHGHCPSKDHHGNLFTSLIAFYGLIPSSTIYAWYVNTNMVPIFQKINELWDFYQP